MRDFDRLLSLVCGISFQPAQFKWLYHLFCSDSKGCSAIYGLTSQSPLFQQQFTHHESWKEEDLPYDNQLLFCTCLSTVRCFLEVDSFSVGFTPQSWFFINYFCPLIEVWNLSGLFTFYATSLLPCKGYGVHNISLIRTHLFSQYSTCSGHARFFLLQDCDKLFVFFSSRGERPDVCQEKITCLYVQLFYCSRTDLFFLHVCHNQQVNLLWTEIWSAGGVERPNWEPPPRTRGQFFLCIFEINFLYSKFCSCGQLNQANPKIPPS